MDPWKIAYAKYRLGNSISDAHATRWVEHWIEDEFLTKQEEMFKAGYEAGTARIHELAAEGKVYVAGVAGRCSVIRSFEDMGDIIIVVKRR